MPEKFIPYHLTPAEQNTEAPEAEVEGLTPEEAREKRAKKHHEDYENRMSDLRKAPDLEKTLETELKEKGYEIPPNRNLSLVFINEFRRLGGEIKTLRRTIKETTDPQEKTKALQYINETKKNIDKYLAYGPSFEKSYREYLSYKTRYFEFTEKIQEASKLQSILEEPTFKSLPTDSKLDEQSHARLEMISRTTKVSTDTENAEDREQLAETLKYVYEEGSKEYQEAVNGMSTEEATEVPLTKKEVIEKVNALNQEIAEDWDDPMVRHFYAEYQLDKTLNEFAKGQDVIETPSVIHNLNKLDEWEKQHQRTTIGGVLVGPPGTGKTTLVHHYLESKDRKYVYIDLSEDVTRYLLYGSKSIDFKNPVEYYRTLAKDISELDGDKLTQFMKENIHSLQKTVGGSEDENAIFLMKQIEEELVKGCEDAPELTDKLNQAKEKFLQMTGTAYGRELSLKLAETVNKNGWKDGVVISALRRGDSILFDEFNKNKNWTLIYGLMTAKPGEKWHFSDNDEDFDIPDNWRMYFTANIGRKHGGFEVPEALASRAQGKVIEVGYAPKKEEMDFGLVALSNPDGNFLRSGEDLVKLYYTVGEFFPKIRNFIEDQKQAVPISYRTLRDLGEKLVLYKDQETGKPVYQPTNKTFDQALYEVLIETSSIYEDKKVPTEIINLAIRSGLLLDDSVRNEVISWVGEKEYEDTKGKYAGHEKDFEEVKKMILGMSSDTSELALPEALNYQ